jgi:hypothetical protein
VRVVVTGSRDFTDEHILDRIIEGLLTDAKDWNDTLFLAHGACPTGADKFVQEWDGVASVAVMPYPANWSRDGNAAGPIRNKKMLKAEDPDLVLAFFKRGAKNRGTKNCVDQAREMNYRVVEVWA